MIRVLAVHADGLTTSVELPEVGGERLDEATRRGERILAEWVRSALVEAQAWTSTPIVYGLVAVQFKRGFLQSHHYDVQGSDVSMRQTPVWMDPVNL